MASGAHALEILPMLSLQGKATTTTSRWPNVRVSEGMQTIAGCRSADVFTLYARSRISRSGLGEVGSNTIVMVVQ